MLNNDSSEQHCRIASPEQSSANSEAITQLVAVLSLARYYKGHGIQSIDFLKVDVEGMEPYVLQGAGALLKERKIAAVLSEICAANLRPVGLSPDDLYREFETARYSPYDLKGDGRPGAKLSLAELEATSLANVVLLPYA